MSEESLEVKEKIQRIELSPELVERADHWLKQIQISSPEISISRKELLNFLLLALPKNLSEEDLAEMKANFYDQVKHLKILLRRAEADKAEGRSASPLAFPLPVAKKRKRARKTADPTTSTLDNSSQEIEKDSESQARVP